VADPAALQLPVLQKAQAELVDYRGSGISIMEGRGEWGRGYSRRGDDQDEEAVFRPVRLIPIRRTRAVSTV
jgi:hypothetical protein